MMLCVYINICVVRDIYIYVVRDNWIIAFEECR